MGQGKIAIFRFADRVTIVERLNIIDLEREFRDKKSMKVLEELFKLYGKHIQDGSSLDINCSSCRTRISLNWNKIVNYWTTN